MGVLFLWMHKGVPLVCGLQVCAHTQNMQGSGTCCSFIAEACACQTALLQLFPDVCLLLYLSLSPFPSFSLPIPFFLLSPTSLQTSSFLPRPVCHQPITSVTFMPWTEIVLFVFCVKKPLMSQKLETVVGSCGP